MLYTITDQQAQDANLVKVIHGVAGRGKSSKVIDYYNKTGAKYIWATSTNKLKRDASNRYGVKAMTVCSALFNNEDGHFYKMPKDTIDADTVIIDEILQTDPRVIDWITDNRGKYNIIVMTDAHQMLTPGAGTSLLRKFTTLTKQPYTITDEGTSTLRARDNETKNEIERLYQSAGDATNEFPAAIASKRYPVILYDDLTYNDNDIYITHTNDIEEALYIDHNLSAGTYTDDQLIPKGSIANRPPKDPSRYPIIPQNEAEKRKNGGYYQLANIGSATRYQGSEVTQSQKLYYIINPDAVVTNREWYTVLSRCHSINSIIIVVKQPAPQPITTYRGKPIREAGVLYLDYAPENSTLTHKPNTIDDESLDAALSANVSTTYAWHPNKIQIANKTYYRASTSTTRQTKSTAKTLIDKEPYLKYNQTEQAYLIIDGPITYARPKSNGKKTRQYNNEIDLKAAYPHILQNERLPIAGKLYTIYTPGKLNFYKCNSTLLNAGAIVTDELAEYVKKHDTNATLQHLFATDYTNGSKLGDHLTNLALGTEEQARRAKLIHYGYYQKKYFKYDGETDTYTRNPEQSHELLMVTILSHLAYIMLTIRDVIGDYNGCFVTDAYHYDGDDRAKEIADHFMTHLTHYHARVYNYTKQTEPVWQNYQNNKKRSHKKCKQTKS